MYVLGSGFRAPEVSVQVTGFRVRLFRAQVPK